MFSVCYTDIDDIIANPENPSLIHPSIMVTSTDLFHIIAQIGSISAAIIEYLLTYYEHMLIIYTCHVQKNADVSIVHRTRYYFKPRGIPLYDLEEVTLNHR